MSLKSAGRKIVNAVLAVLVFGFAGCERAGECGLRIVNLLKLTDTELSCCP